MKTIYLHFDDLEQFKTLDPMTQRMSILGFNNRYNKSFTTFSDDNGVVYIGHYTRSPHLSMTGNIYFKTICDSSVTFKNGRFYGDKMRINEICDFEPYQWLRGIRVRLSSLPITILRKVLEKKITSQEDLWKEIAKTSYKDKHWKVVKFCKTHNIPLMWLKMCCPNYEGILSHNTVESINADTYIVVELLRYAVATNTQVNIMWSHRRMWEEIEGMKSKIIDIQLQSKDDTPIWNLESIPWPGDFLSGEFRLLNSERDVFATAEKLHNCVYRNYFGRMKQHKYIAFVSGDTCVGYQITEDRDVLLDQMRGKYNAPISSETQDGIDRILRPIAQAIAESNPIIKDNNPYLPF